MKKQEFEITKTACFDFDGVIASYEGWKGFDVLGKPNNEVIEVMKELTKMGVHVVIWTTRPDTPTIRKWLKDNKVPFNSINSNAHNPPTTSSKPIYHAFIDDRAIHYKGQGQQFLLDQIVAMIQISHRKDQ